MLKKLVFLGLLMHGVADAQTTKNQPGVVEREMGNCSGQHRERDTLHCYVTFDGMTEFTQVEVSFNLPVQPPPGSPGSYVNFVLRESSKVDEYTYEVSGVLPDCVPGNYILAAVSVKLGESGGRLYSNGYQFSSRLRVQIANDGPSKLKGEKREWEKDSSMLTPSMSLTLPDEKELEEEATARKLKAGLPMTWEEAKSECGGSHQPGERVTCMVTFKGSPDFGGVLLNFNLRTTIVEEQKGLCNAVLLQASERIDEQTYRVTGELPLCATGRYTFAQLVPAGGGRGWDEPEFESKIVLRLENRDRSTFPNVKKVSEKPRSQ